jgi:hypothetical protein
MPNDMKLFIYDFLEHEKLPNFFYF